jgi:predicted Zn finger-like uncharacterized protein
MEIICPHCNTIYAVRENRNLFGKRRSAVCKRCGHKISIERPDRINMNEANGVQEDLLPGASPRVPFEGIPVSTRGSVTAWLYEEYPELQRAGLEKLDLSSIFAWDTQGRKRRRKCKGVAEILRVAYELLDKILEEGEMVKKVGWGTAYYFFEIFFGNGLLTLLYNRYCIFATNRRLLFINVNYRMKRRAHYLFQLPFPYIKRIRRGVLGGNLTFYKSDGKRRHFVGMKPFLSKELYYFVKEKTETDSTRGKGSVTAENLCPVCFSPLPNGLVRCTHCWAAFKRPRKASLRSLMLPGLGDFYLGHRLLGALEMTGSMLVWLVVVFSFLSGVPAHMMVAGVILLWVNGCDALLTHHMANKGYMLEKKNARTLSQLPSTGRFEKEAGLLPESA